VVSAATLEIISSASTDGTAQNSVEDKSRLHRIDMLFFICLTSLPFLIFHALLFAMSTRRANAKKLRFRNLPTVFADVFFHVLQDCCCTPLGTAYFRIPWSIESYSAPTGLLDRRQAGRPEKACEIR
jgi:hypothetical protein